MDAYVGLQPSVDSPTSTSHLSMGAQHILEPKFRPSWLQGKDLVHDHLT